jgi:dipeptidyl-peptidase 4
MALRACTPTAPPTAPSAVGATLLLTALLAGGLLPASGAAQTNAPTPTVDYRQAEQFLPWHANNVITGGPVAPQWIDDTPRFWYRTNTGTGFDFRLVDPVRNTVGPAFDRHRLASAMSLASDTAFDGTKLPFQTFRFTDGGAGIEFTARRKRWECDIQQYNCMVGDTLPGRQAYVVSPDSTLEAFVQEHDLYVRTYRDPRDSTNATPLDTIRLTTDGEEFFAYGLTAPSPTLQRTPAPRRPGVTWSPDSRRLVVSRMDQRNVEHMHYISMTSQRPRHFSQPYALPGDSVIPIPSFHIIDVASRGNTRVEMDPVPHQLQLGGSGADSLWASDGEKVYVSWFTRASKSVRLGEVDVNTGAVQVLARDSAATFVEFSPRDPSSWYVTRDGQDVIWWSQRDGWPHLWRLDRNGEVKNRITQGPWAVGAVRWVDEANRQIWFTARGREEGVNPYYAQLYRVGYDGSGLTRMSTEAADHDITFSPDGQFYVEVTSTVATPATSRLRRTRDNQPLRDLEQQDMTAMEAIGWAPVQEFTVKARDGITDIHGLLYLPPNLDTTRVYPVIDHIYPGPQVGSVGAWSFKSSGENFALAQLGFVVVQIDHLGTPLRSKAFHDAYYGNFIDNGIPDHVTAIKQLGARHRFMDLDRVGIYGHSGGGFASTAAMLNFPEFFKVAVSGAGNHDNASYNIYWAEKYQGLLVPGENGNGDNFTPSANKTHAANLQGKLLLTHGDMDDNVHPAMTIQLVDELIKANRDFDLIIAPNRGHGLNEPYFIRRRWDYFVTHLMGGTPPPQYEITRPEG